MELGVTAVGESAKQDYAIYERTIDAINKESELAQDSKLSEV
jgi:hypothetical protein